MPCPSHPPWLDHSNYTSRRRVPYIEESIFFSRPIILKILFTMFETIRPKETSQLAVVTWSKRNKWG
jgi:hypothetical protein